MYITYHPDWLTWSLILEPQLFFRDLKKIVPEHTPLWNCTLQTPGLGVGGQLMFFWKQINEFFGLSF
jgi:hypothetical protein